MNYKYFGYCPDAGFELFLTEKEAKQYAQDAVDWFRDEALEGWSEEVTNVCWGELKQETVITDRKTIKEAEEELGLSLPAYVSGYVDYGLKDI